MSTNYPTGLDSFTAVTPGQRRDGSGSAPQESALFTNIGDAVEAIQAELGLNPSGAQSTVLARLDLVDTNNWRLRDIIVTGTLTVAAGVIRYKFPVAVTILGITLAVNTAPTGAAILVDINKNGTTIFSTQGNRPTIAISAFATAAEVTNMNTTAVAAGDYLTADVDQIGSTAAGANLVVTVRYKPT